MKAETVFIKAETVLLRVKEAAVLLSMPVSSVYALVYAEMLPVVRLGKRSIRIPRAAIQALVAKAMRGSGAVE